MEINETSAILLGLVSAIALAVLHLLAPRIRRLPFVPEHVTSSFAGGIAVSYVFLHLLPELAEGNERLREVLSEEGERSPLLGLEIFLVALVGLLIFYGLERLAEQSKGALRTPRAASRTTRVEQPLFSECTSDHSSSTTRSSAIACR